jgi:hypothetical protein
MKTNPDDTEGNDTMPPPPASDASSASPSTEICLSLQSLAMPDDQEQMNPPEEGDKVQANIEGTVNRIESDMAYVTLDAVNGEKVKQNAPEPTDDQEEESLRGIAASQPDRY